MTLECCWVGEQRLDRPDVLLRHRPRSISRGHAKIGITLDRYGHLMPGSEEEAASLLDSYLDAERKGVEDTARSAGVVQEPCLTGERTGEQLANRN